MDKQKHHESHLVSVLTFLFIFNPIWATSGTNSTANVQVVHFLCNRSTSTIGFLYMKPAFDLAHETVQKRLEDGTYKGFNLSVIYSYDGCNPRSLGSGVDLYIAQPYHAIFGPPASSYTIGKNINIREKSGKLALISAR